LLVVLLFFCVYGCCSSLLAVQLFFFLSMSYYHSAGAGTYLLINSTSHCSASTVGTGWLTIFLCPVYADFFPDMNCWNSSWYKNRCCSSFVGFRVEMSFLALNSLLLLRNLLRLAWNWLWYHVKFWDLKKIEEKRENVELNFFCIIALTLQHSSLYIFILKLLSSYYYIPLL
jgi:hypothetical protein